jgi:lipoprotein-releasing system permease protein
LKVAGFIANRIAFNQQRSFSRFIIRLSIAATVISVAVMIITLAFVDGFQEAVSKKVFSFWGHMHIQDRQPVRSLNAEQTPIVRNDTLIDLIRQNPEVIDIHAFAIKNAMLKTKNDIELVLFKGFDSTYDFQNLRQFITAGRPIHFPDTSTYSREIMISAYTANVLHLKVNDPLFIYFIRPNGQLRPDKLTISGIYKTGIEDYDKNFAIGDIRLIRRLNDWFPDQVGGYEIFLRNNSKIDTTTNEIYNMDKFPPTWDVQSVKDIAPNIFDWLKMQNITRNLLIGIMLFVALINLVTCLLILVLERIPMIGVLKSLGATDWTVQLVFLRHSLFITITGILLGLGVGLGILYLQKATGFIKLNEEAYYLSEAAVRIVWSEVAFVCGATLFVCIAILMIPTILVRKIQPVKAVQFR